MAANLKNTIISLTTVPWRINDSLLTVLDSLSKQPLQVIVNIPLNYIKWTNDIIEIPNIFEKYKNVIIHRNEIDYGPATKLIGGLEYVKNHVEYNHIKYIITVDDDHMFTNPVESINAWFRESEKNPDYALTLGGIKLNNFPYHFQNGLGYGTVGNFVDGVAGYRSVLYPIEKIKNSDVIYNLKNQLPLGIFNDDDAYFGMVLSVLGIPLFAINDENGFDIQGLHDGKSAVSDNTDIARCDNEELLYQTAVKLGYLPNNNNNNETT